VLALLWATNLYNFMDGIDGIATVEAITVSGAAAALFAVNGDRELVVVSLTILAVSSGFLAWNWEPSRIFMGDVGSGFFGFAFGWLAIAGEQHRPGSLLWIALLAGVFLADATLTLIRRAAHGERFYHAHRNHAYQRLSRVWSSHSRVSTGVLILNLFLGALVLIRTLYPWLPVIVAVVSIVTLAAVYTWVEVQSPMYERQRTGGVRDR
jgi:Fuc2NAc and GlcNAc transferase